MREIKTILLATDFSDTAAQAVDSAITLARRFDAGIVAVYVEEDRLPPLVIEYMAVAVDDMMDKQVDRARERLQAFVEEYLAGLPGTEIEVGIGTPHVEIVRIAESRKVDLIVMATHGRGFITHAILGSTTERVLRRAPCPVLVVRRPEETD